MGIKFRYVQLDGTSNYLGPTARSTRFGPLVAQAISLLIKSGQVPLAPFLNLGPIDRLYSIICSISHGLYVSPMHHIP